MQSALNAHHVLLQAVQVWFKCQISEAVATHSFKAAMLAIASCAGRVRSVLDIFVHPSTLSKLQHMLNAELVPKTRPLSFHNQKMHAKLFYFTRSIFRRKRRLDGCSLTSSLPH